MTHEACAAPWEGLLWYHYLCLCRSPSFVGPVELLRTNLLLFGFYECFVATQSFRDLWPAWPNIDGKSSDTLSRSAWAARKSLGNLSCRRVTRVKPSGNAMRLAHPCRDFFHALIQFCDYAGRRQYFWADVAMVCSWMMFGPVVSIVHSTWAPIDTKLFEGFSIAKPMESHVHCFGAFWLHFVIDDSFGC